MNILEAFRPFEIYKKKFIEGLVEIYDKKNWLSISYLQYKDVLKICSFFYFNYGTINPQKNINNNYFAVKLIETIHCHSNASNIENCIFIKTKSV